MKHIAQPFPPSIRPQRKQTVIITAETVLRAILRTFNGHPARLLSIPGSRRIRAAVKHLSGSVVPALSSIIEAVVSALWLLFLIFGLNIFAALV